MKKSPTPLQWIRPPRQVRTQKSLERFLDAAEDLLSAKSFEDVHVADVADRAGSSVPAFYRRFKDKNALLHALHERKCEEALATADHALRPDRWKGANIQEILASGFPFIVSILKQHESLERAVLQRALSDGNLWERAIRVRRHVMDGLSELLLERRSEIRHPEPTVAVSFALVQAMALLTEYYTVGLRDIQRNAMSDQQVVDELLSSCLAYLQWQEA